jgi:hypothetical protein
MKFENIYGRQGRKMHGPIAPEKHTSHKKKKIKR